jgi:hypothetical protein
MKPIHKSGGATRQRPERVSNNRSLAIVRRAPMNFSAIVRNPTLEYLKPTLLASLPPELRETVLQFQRLVQPRKSHRAGWHHARRACSGTQWHRGRYGCTFAETPVNVNCAAIVRRSSSFRSARILNRATRNICAHHQPIDRERRRADPRHQSGQPRTRPPRQP